MKKVYKVRSLMDKAFLWLKRRFDREIYKVFGKKKGSQKQINGIVYKQFGSRLINYMTIGIFKTFGEKKRSQGGRIRLMRLPDKQLGSRPSGFKTLYLFGLRVPALTLNFCFVGVRE